MAQASTSSATQRRGDGRAAWDYKDLFRGLPGAYLVLATDPDFTIVDASESYALPRFDGIAAHAPIYVSLEQQLIQVY